MTGPYPPQQPDPAYHGPPPGAPPQFPPQFPAQFPPPFAPHPGRAPRDRMVIALVAIIATLLVLCLAMAVGSVYFLRDDPAADDKTSKILDHHPAGG